MTAPLFWVSRDQLVDAEVGGQVSLTGDEAHHAVAALRLRPGQVVYLSDAAGTRLTGSVSQVVGRSQARLDVLVEEIEHQPAHKPLLTLVQALTQDRADELAVASATQLGVDRIIPWRASRSVTRWEPNRAAKHQARWERLARAEGKVARRARLPRICPVVDSAGLTRLIGDETGNKSAHGIVLSENSTEPLADLLEAAKTANDVLLIVGPEGSISQTELDGLERVGARSARLGPEVLRASLAGAAALVLACHVLGRWA
ncbi:MAG: 16S rRNA (uracil(1498)-N(3))-methyltransferase [Bifidobacteriaceae bacterium]|jgi:16S rRNA (uracil1498-N3)-methyltransferase|nr:16S rRNA (uracil(1498)-N(3))-methyltransferase [Bifidobacteriaceae bacterium]